MSKRLLGALVAVVAVPVVVTAAQPSVPAFAAVTPSATVSSTQLQPFIGEQARITVAFDNTGSGAADTGYGPYVELRFDAAGADGAGAAIDDGMTFASASYLGANVAATLSVTCTGTPVQNPLTLQNVPCAAGNQLVILQLPFGSFTADQPVANLDVSAAISNLADAGRALPVVATAGFAYGNSPTGTTPIVSAVPQTITFTPQVIRFTKSYIGPELETATGPNFPRGFRLAVDVATGVTVTTADIVDVLPAQHQFLAVTGTSGATTSLSTPSTTTPGGTLSRRFGSIVGTSSAEDAWVEFSYFIPEFAAGGARILDVTTGDDVATLNDGQATVSYTAIDTRDSPTPVTLNPNSTTPPNPDNIQMTAKSIAVQKSVAIAVPTGDPGYTPGDTLEYTIQGQISDYFTFDDVVIDDVLGDGQTYLTDYVPTLSVTNQGVTTTSTIAATDATISTAERPATCSPTSTGTTAIRYRVSDAFAAALPEANGFFTGGRTNGGTGGPSTFTITFRAVIDDAYTCKPSPDNKLDSRDNVVNDVTVSGDIYQNGVPATVQVGTETDGSGTRVDIAPSSIAKGIYARNGSTSGLNGSPIQFAANDLITYRITMRLPSSDVSSLQIADFLPLPVLAATNLTTTALTNNRCATTTDVPGLNQWCFGPADTFQGAFPALPTLVADTAANSITWTYGTREAVDNLPRTVELLFTLRISTAPFREGLFLTNQVQATENNSTGAVWTSPAIVQMELTEPLLNIDKGVVEVTSNAPTTPTFNANRYPTGSVTSFGAAGSAGCARTPAGSVVTTTNTTAGFPDANLGNADANDTVRFAITVENTGRGLNGAFDTTISDVIPSGFQIPSTGLNLCVTNGAGTTLPYTSTGFFGLPAGSAAPLGTGTLTLTDNASTGALTATNPTSGTNIAVVTYDLQLVPTTAANTSATTLTNTATITNYAASEGGASFTGITVPANLTDNATVSTRSITIAKVLTGTDQTTTTGANVAIGERATYTVTVTVPEGTTNNVTVVDTLPTGLAVADPAPVAATTSGITMTGSPTPTVPANGSTLTYGLGTVTSTGASTGTITLTYSVVVLDIAANQSPNPRANAARVSFTNGQGTTTTSNPAQVTVTIVEPNLDVTKTSNTPTVDADDVITYTIQVAHAAQSSNAHEVVLRDLIPTGMTYQTGSLALVSGVAPDAGTLTHNAATNEIEAAWTQITTASSSVIKFDVKVATNYNAVSTFTNNARITWTSLPGSPTATTYNAAGVERTGADGPGGALNDYAEIGSVAVQPIAPQITKTLLSTDQTSTTGTNVTIGEVVDYRLNVTLPDGQFPGGFVVVDELPLGLQYLASSVDVSTFAGTLPAPTVTGGSSNGEDVTYTFGASANPPDNDPSNNTIGFVITARVLDVVGNRGILPTQTSLSNTGTAQLVGGALVRSTAVATTVVEPNIALTKAMTPSNPPQGGTVSMTITATNNGTGNAYGTVITDQLNTNIDWTTVTDIVAPSPWTSAYDPATGVLVFRLADPTPLTMNAPVAFTFQAKLQAVLPIGTPVPNTAVASGVTSLPGTVTGERTEPTTSGSAQINTAGPDLRITKDDGKATVAVATPTLTTNTYNLVVTNTGGFQATGVRIVDTLPAGTSFVSVGGDPRCSDGGASGANRTIVVAGAIAASGGTVTCAITLSLTYPAPVGTTGYSNIAVVSDDGAGGVDPTPTNNTATDVDTLVGRAPDLVVTKTDGRTILAPGEQTTYTVTVTNVGNIGVADVLVTDTVPGGLNVTGCAPVTGAVSVACSAAANIVTIRYASIAGGGGSASFTVSATVNNPVDSNLDTVTNTATAADNGANGGDPTPANNTGTDVDDIDAAPDMRIVKSANATTVAPGGAVQYTLTVDDHGPQAARNVVVTDTIDPLMTVDCASVLPTPTSCNPTTGVITWGSATTGLQSNGTIATNGTFAAGSSIALTYTANAKTPLPAGTVDFDNTATVTEDGSNGPDPTADNTSSVKILLTGRAPNLRIVKDDGRTNVTPGAPFAYTLTITNTGNVGVTGARVTDLLPAGLVLNSCTLDGAPCSPTGSPLTLNIGAVQVGTPRVVVLTVTATSPAAAGLTSLTNVASVAIIDEVVNGADTDLTDNTDDDVDTLDAAPDLVITKSDSATSRTAGESFSYTITVANVGNQNATGVSVVDTVPGLLTADACTPSRGTCQIVGDVVTWTVGTLAGLTGTAVLTLDVTLDSQVAALVGTFANTATVTDGGVNGADPTPSNNTATDTDTLIATPDMEISKSDGELDVTPGQTLTYSIVVDNSGAQTAQGVDVTDTLPAGVTFVGCTPACDSTTTPGQLFWNDLIEDTPGSPDSLGFDAGGRVTLTVEVTVDTPATSERIDITNVVSVADNGVNGPDPTPSNNTGEDVDTVSATPDMRIEKTAVESAVTPGGIVDYRLTVSNVGDQDARNVVVTDTIDAQMTLDCSAGAIVPAPTSCNSTTGVVTWGSATTGLTDEGPVVANGIFTGGESIVLTYSAEADDPLAATTTGLTNTATVTDDGLNGTDPTPLDNTDTLTVPLAGNGPELAVVKSDGVTSVTPGDTVEYTLIVTNTGNIGSTGVVVTDVLPAGLTFVSCTLDGVVCTPVAGDVAIGSLPGRTGRRVLVITASVDAPAVAERDTIVNTATIDDDHANGPDSVPENNTDTDTDLLDAAPVLTITKDDGATSHAAGDTYDYTITVINTGDQDTTGVLVSDTVPEGLTAVSCPATPVPCAISGDDVTWTIGDLPGGGGTPSTRVLTLTVRVDDALADGVDDATNTATVTDDPAGNDTPVTASASDQSDFTSTPDMVIGKDDGVAVVEPGDVLTYTITVDNAGDQTATGVDVVDTLPPGTTFVSCTLVCDSTVPGTLTWTDLQETTPGSPADPSGFDAGGRTVLTVVVSVDSPAAPGIDDLPNHVTVTDDGTNGADPTPLDNEDDDVDVLDAAPDLSISKDDGVLSVVGGDDVTYSITFTNDGTQHATGVTVTDVLPAGVTFVSCSDGCISAAAPTVVWPIGTLPVGDERTYELTVRVDDPVASTTRHLVNTVVIADDLANGADPTPADNSSSDDDTTGIDLAVTKTDDRTTTIPGEPVTYTITVTNNGPTTIRTFELEDTLPAALSGVTFTPSAGSYDATTHVWSGFGDMAEGDVLTIEVTGTVDAAATGTLTNSVVVRPPTSAPETNPADNSATDVDTLTPAARLTIDKQLTSGLVRGSRSTFVVRVTNAGPSVATDVVVTDFPPAALVFVGAGVNGFACSPAASSPVVCTLDTPLRVGQTRSLELTFDVVGDFGSRVTNTARVTSPVAMDATSVLEAAAVGSIAPSAPAAPPATPAPSAPVPPAGIPLPRTGASPLPTLLWAGFATLLGVALVVGVRRRRARPVS